MKNLYFLLLIFLVSLTVGKAQEFSYYGTNPYNFQENRNTTLSFVDIDNDGDQDVFSGSTKLVTIYNDDGSLIAEGQVGTVLYYKNSGTSESPNFEPPVESPFGIDTGTSNCFPSFTDIDSDGDFDAFVSSPQSENGVIKFYKNEGTPTSPMFAEPVNNPFGINNPSEFNIPVFADFDNDSDDDLLLGGFYQGEYFYQENTGNQSTPSYSSLTNLSLSNKDPKIIFPTAGDIDLDGDIDIISAEYYGTMGEYQFEVTEIEFLQYEKSGHEYLSGTSIQGVQVGSYILPSLVDINGDGTLDLYVITERGVELYLNNVTTSITSAESGNLNIYPNPASKSLNLNITDLRIEEIMVFNSVGQVKDRFYPQGQEDIQINLEAYSKGIYKVIVITTDGHKLIETFTRM